jgi:hypothetical protein
LLAHEAPEARARRFVGATGSDNVEIVEVDPAEVRVPVRIRIDPETHNVHRLPSEPDNCTGAFMRLCGEASGTRRR